MLIGADDCAARRLLKAEETEDINGCEITANDDECEKEKTNDDECGKEVDPNNDKAEKKSGGKSQYEKDREKNIAEVKDLLENLKEQYPMPEELARKEVPNVPAVKKGKKGRNEPTTTTRRESQRTKDKIR